MVYVVDTYGEVYRPILDRLNAEIEARRPGPGLHEVPMPRTAANVTQADIARAIRAMRDAAGHEAGQGNVVTAALLLILYAVG